MANPGYLSHAQVLYYNEPSSDSDSYSDSAWQKQIRRLYIFIYLICLGFFYM